jgi:hypothetical protein
VLSDVRAGVKTSVSLLRGTQKLKVAVVPTPTVHP